MRTNRLSRELAIYERVMKASRYILANSSTVRGTCKALHLGRSTVHKDFVVRLHDIDAELYKDVTILLQKNKRERSMRGGEATRQRCLRIYGIVKRKNV